MEDRAEGEGFVVDIENKATPTYRMKHAGLGATIQLPGMIQINYLYTAKEPLRDKQAINHTMDLQSIIFY